MYKRDVAAEAAGILAKAKAITARAEREGRDLTEAEVAEADGYIEALKGLKSAKDHAEADRRLATAIRDFEDFADGGNGGPSKSRGREWAMAVAEALSGKARQLGVKALISGSVDVPAVIEPGVVEMPRRPDRLIDLLINRETLTGNVFEFLRQSVRTNNAAPVADHGTKPTSVYTTAPVEDRARVIAHLSEAIPERYLVDYPRLVDWLETEMFDGVLDALEAQVVSGDGTGENMTGILNTSGTIAVPWSTDILTTLRKARTALQTQREVPTAWVLHPTDLETLDLLADNDNRFYERLDNIWGDIPRVVSTSVPAGTGLLADWRRVSLLVRQETQLDADRSGDLFDKNEVKFRAEGRFGLAVLRPSAFAEIDLTAV